MRFRVGPRSCVSHRPPPSVRRLPRRGRRPRLQFRKHPLHRQRVDDVGAPGPAAPSNADAVQTREAKVAGVVGIGIDGELHARVARAANLHVGQVEAVGLRVDLEHRSRPRGRGDHGVHVEVDRGATAELPRVRVEEDVRVAGRFAEVGAGERQAVGWHCISRRSDGTFTLTSLSEVNGQFEAADVPALVEGKRVGGAFRNVRYEDGHIDAKYHYSGIDSDWEERYDLALQGSQTIVCTIVGQEGKVIQLLHREGSKPASAY